MAKGDDGQMWVCDPYNSAVWRLKAGAEPEREPQPAWLVVNDRDGALLLGWKRDIERRHKGQVEKIALPEIPGPDGKPQDLTLMGLTDDGKRMWAVSMQTGLILRVNGQWAPRSRFKLPPNIVLGTPGVNSGETWLATGEGNIVLFDAEDKLTSYPAPMIGLATGLFAGEEIVASGDQGVAVLAGGAFQRLQAADPEVLLNVSGLAVSADGDRWLNGGKGLVHVRRDDWKASIANPALPLRYQLFGVPDGYVGKAALENRAPSARIDQAGNLWLASSGGILRLDTRAVPRNTLAPVPAVLELHAGQARHDGRAAQVLAPGSQNFDISYTAASLRQPESVRFQYRLEGEDSAWQDAGARRTAYYTNIAPGSYRFQVRAANEDGVWSAQPASLAFEIPPTVTQTLWFKAICVIAAAGALYLLYLYRLRIVTAQLEERMEVRLAERERIARTLHDTFLQSMQGVVLRLDAAVDALPDGDATRQTLAPVLHSARDSISEGRAQVHELRESAPDDIESGLHDIAHLLAASYPGIRFALGVTGNRQPLRADVAGELKEIGLEAVRNAYQHADASAIDVTLDYGQQQFTLTVRDDGNGGAAGPAAAAGHWGVIGMRERAGRIGATLKIAGVPAQGSSVTLTLPAGRAYAGSSLSWWRRLFG
jgi:signal transduction histidine kinase